MVLLHRAIGIDKTPNSMFNHSVGIMDGDFATTLN